MINLTLPFAEKLIIDNHNEIKSNNDRFLFAILAWQHASILKFQPTLDVKKKPFIETKIRGL